MSHATLSPQELAQAVRTHMLAQDRASLGLGMEVVAIAPGSAAVQMRVRADMLNGFGICHGGFITTLADSAFAFACNSRNVLTVAQGLSVDFVAPAREGDVLLAQAQEQHLAGRTGVYDVRVTRADGSLVAVMRGKSYALKGKCVLPELG
ncbi:hydroxyphenylacetyl-CoA thioesterase PaaI [Roseateles sp. BYS180W]|uniref:Hydroxyphenylacetyl-CoA thioesterase PaaI n=1 Tax=Roseateles rivi TaxID=3299028 RepID=A0ABW7FYB4_9BURK